MTKLDKVAASHNCKFLGVGVYAYKRYHVYKVIVVLHIYYKILGIGLAGHPTNKNTKIKVWPLSNCD